MKTSDLHPFIQPVVEKPVCRGCKVFAPECLVPHGDGAIPMCWLCAHHVVEHDGDIDDAYTGECECLPSEIFPHHKCEPAGACISCRDKAARVRRADRAAAVPS